jgi:uncharacterized protein with von Willebrand factor type A (vWA) domain
VAFVSFVVDYYVHCRVMGSGAQEPQTDGGRLVENLMHFARVLRSAGVPIGPGRVLDAIEAVRAVGITDRRDFYWTLHAVFVNRADQREIFDQAFHVFWRNPRILERMLSLALPATPEAEEQPGETLHRRLGEALTPGGGAGKEREKPPQLEIEATLTWSDHERLRKKDFEQMSAQELARAKAAVAGMRLPVMQMTTRRFRHHPHGSGVDMRASLRSALRSGPGMIPLVRERRRLHPPPLVILCDISGSMSRYSRMLLHFMHALTSDRDRVYSFVFGTRLTNITRYVRERDVDVALAKVGDVAQDWGGGTRIGRCLHDFNRYWSRRLPLGSALVLFITDGLDRDAGEGLEREMERLHKSCRRVLWLNPLLRYEGFEPLSLGMRAMLPHVDDLRAVHNLESLEQLAEVVSRPARRRTEGVTHWLRAAS